MHPRFPFCLVISLALTIPPLVLAQGALERATLTGTVRDASGGVLPGVTVEAASPALIEKVRTAVTDSSGVYRIVNLDPGAYTLTFALEGFSLAPGELEDRRLAADFRVMMRDVLGAPRRDQFRQRLPGEAREGKVDDVGVAEQVVEERFDGVE
jgi:hypothetical protein